MKSLNIYINEAKSQKLKDVYSEVKKICGKAKFFWEPSQWSMAFKWKDDYITIKRPRGLRSQQYDLNRDYDGDLDKAIEDIIDIFTNKDHFLQINCHTELDVDIDKLDIKKYTICRVRPEQIYAVCPIWKNGEASVYGNKDVKWTLDRFDLDEETFENYKQMRQKAKDKFIKEQGKRFDKQDKGFRVVLATGKRFFDFSFDGMEFNYRENKIPLSDIKAIKNKILELVK